MIRPMIENDIDIAENDKTAVNNNLLIVRLKG